MSVSGVGSKYFTNQIASNNYNKINHANQLSTSSTRFNSDSVEISNEAQQLLHERNKLNDFTSKAYSMLKQREISDEDINEFKGIVEEAQYAPNAKDYLKSLSSHELDLVKRANSYAIDLSNFHINGMSEEGARNMLVQPDNRFSVDLNNDGMVEHGQAVTFQFPPPNAPSEVKEAWDKTIGSMSESEQLLASGIFMIQSLNANLKTDESGEVIGWNYPGDEGYKNIFPTNVNNWDSFLDEIDDYLDLIDKLQPNNDQTKKDRELIGNFRTNLFG